MKNVKEVLSEYKKELKTKASGAKLGDSESALLKNLDKVITRNRHMVYVILGMLVVSFILAITFIWYWREDTNVLIGIFSATGITFTWTINTVINLWKEISKAETIAVLVAHTDDKDIIRDIIKTLSENIYKTAS